MGTRLDRWMITSDEQIPFEHKDALDFQIRVKRHFGIPDENQLHVGDETDQALAGMYDPDPDGDLTANQEYQQSLDALQLRYLAFPRMKVAISNHGVRWQKRAFKSGIPSFVMRSYENMIEAPDGWKWQKKWLIRAKHPFVVEHGDRFGGQTPHVQAAMANGLSTVIGHHHSIAGIEHIRTQDYHPEFNSGFDIWGASTGALIDFDRFAFKYAQSAKKKPKLGLIVVLDDGKWPIWVPL